MRWLWQRTEHRASATDALVAAIVAAAGNQGTGDHRAIAAVETAAGLYASAFASAEVETDDARVAARLTPAFLSMMARSLIRRGEFLAVLEATPGRGLELLPAGSWDVRGGRSSLTGGIGRICLGRVGLSRGPCRVLKSCTCGMRSIRLGRGGDCRRWSRLARLARLRPIWNSD